MSSSSKKPTSGSTSKLVEFDDSNRNADKPIEFDPQAYSAPSKKTQKVVQTKAIPSLTSAEIPSEFYAARNSLLEWLGNNRGPQFLAASVAASGHKFGAENVLGVGIGVRESAGAITGDLAVKVYVQEKLSQRRVRTESIVPGEIGGIPTDVTQIGVIRKLSYARKYDRPVPSGVSCGHPDITAGTIGCLVVLENNRLALLSNNHVLANENAASVGDPVIQPGRIDGGSIGDLIGQLEYFEPITFTADNFVDAAVAWTSRSLVSPTHVTYKLDPTPVPAAPLMTVIKNGRTTQATTGWVEAIDVDSIQIEYDNGIATFSNQIVVKSLSAVPFSQGGDSGSLIVTSGSKQPVGLLFAGSNTHTIANPIVAVMEAMKINRFYVG